ncbi:hypothetical protein [Mesorhizobium erdmanii]|uniref:hypothetical protein n=1 Tax=Mesorhizobium erdmanii TaxID=1777866 RepID=UPI0012B520BF|nr:hypothetical protein [Mesorhizobium erdmanii]
MTLVRELVRLVPDRQIARLLNRAGKPARVERGLAIIDMNVMTALQTVSSNCGHWSNRRKAGQGS